jgi:hypothetical protein
MPKCPECKIGELVRRETKECILLECSRRGTIREDRECDYCERYSKEDEVKLARKEREWNELVKGAV